MSAPPVTPIAADAPLRQVVLDAVVMTDLLAAVVQMQEQQACHG